MAKRVRLAALALAAAVLFALLFSFGMIAAFSGHDCAGEDCPICLVIGLCTDTFRVLGGILAAGTVLFCVLCAAFSRNTVKKAAFTAATPISHKVKLSE